MQAKRLAFWLVALASTLILGPNTGSAQTAPLVSVLAWHPTNNDILALGRADGSIVIRDVAANQALQTLYAHTDRVASLAWSPDASMLASSGWDNSVIVWDVSTGEPISMVPLRDPLWMQTLAFNNEGTFVLGGNSGAQGGVTLHVWEAATGNLVYEAMAGEVYTIEFDRLNDRFAVGGLTPIFAIHSGSSFERLGISRLADNGIRPEVQLVDTLAWNADSTLVATGHMNGIVRVWDMTADPITASLELIANDTDSLDYDIADVRAVIFRACDRQVVAYSANGTLRGWETETGEVFIDDQFDDGIIAAEFSPDGSLLAYSADGVDDIVIEPVSASPAPCDIP